MSDGSGNFAAGLGVPTSEAGSECGWLVAADNREHCHASAAGLLAVLDGQLARALPFSLVGVRPDPDVELLTSVKKHDVVHFVQERLLGEIWDLFHLELSGGVGAVKQTDRLRLRLGNNTLKVICFATKKRPKFVTLRSFSKSCFDRTKRRCSFVGTSVFLRRGVTAIPDKGEHGSTVERNKAVAAVEGGRHARHFDTSYGVADVFDLVELLESGCSENNVSDMQHTHWETHDP